MSKEIRFYWKILSVIPGILLLFFTEYEFSFYYLILVFLIIGLVENTNILNSKKGD